MAGLEHGDQSGFLGDSRFGANPSGGIVRPGRAVQGTPDSDNGAGQSLPDVVMPKREHQGHVGRTQPAEIPPRGSGSEAGALPMASATGPGENAETTEESYRSDENGDEHNESRRIQRQPRGPILRGERSGRMFEKGELIDVGGNGKIFKAYEDGLVYAMKLPDPVDDSRYADKFTREAQYQAQFSHPHITRVVLIDTTRNELPYASVPFLITPLAESNLYSRILVGSLTISQRVDMSEQTADALSEIHGKGFVYGDIKPQNVLLRRNQQGGLIGELTDFGDTIPLEELSKRNTLFNELYTPLTEQLVWAQDIVYPTMIGKSYYPADPFDRHSFESMLTRGNMTVLHDAVEAVVDRAMQQNPLHRYPSMADLYDDLRMRRAKAMEARKKDRKYFHSI